MYPSVIVVPLDGSELAEAALSYAESVAHATSATLRLIGVVDTGHQRPSRNADPTRDRLTMHELESLEKYLFIKAHALQTRGVRASVMAVAGSPVDEILTAQEPDVAMLVMATHGRGGFQRLRLGSVADRVVHAATLPVLLVAPPAAGAPEAVELRRIAVPLDGSALAESALPLAKALADASHATLTLVRVESFLMGATAAYPYAPSSPDLEAGIEEAAAAYLEHVRVTQCAGTQTESIVLRGTAAASLIQYFQELPADLVVMTTHGRGGFKRLVLGSTADRLVRSGVPVLLIRAQAAAAPPQEPAVPVSTSNSPVG
jgi:nucleotide-binding universal stress UspA family protein